MTVHLPTLNASLNGAAAAFLFAGYFFVRRKRYRAHMASMIGALLCSAAFLTTYLYHHYHAGATRFTGTGALRSVYFFILATHTVLATAILPLVVVTVARAARRDFGRHAAIARWTWPVWVYVSLTGVAVYWMLYRL